MDPWLIPPWYHPADLIAVDDEQGLLESLELALGGNFRLVGCETATKAREALAAGTRPLESGTTLPVFGNPLDTGRFSLAAVVLVDFGLSGMTGLDLLRGIEGHPIRRILYSGMSDMACVEEARREGVVDQFIAKHDRHFLERLESMVDELTWRFFVERGKEVVDSPGRLLSSPGVARLLSELRERHRIVEHYLYRDHSGFLLLDEEGEAFRLAIGITSDDAESDESGVIEESSVLTWSIVALPKPFGDEVITPYSNVSEGKW